MPTIRTDVVKLFDQPATLIGDDVVVGQQAPEFTASAFDWSPVNPVAESRGKVAILSAVPALDTRVCDIETRRFNQEAASLSEDILIWTISTDPPPTQKRWCGAAGIDRVRVVSDVLETEFGEKYGLLIKERRFLRRAVFVVNRDGVLTYVAYMAHNGLEPDYDEVIQAARDAL
ncbi:MAG: thiol peroxidase [Caldilineales bacterium]